MVRRRTRAAKPIVSVGEDGSVNVVMLAQGLQGAAVTVAANGNMLEDQYFASPKRKDCKIDSGGCVGGGGGESAEALQLVCEAEEQIFVESNKTRKSPSPGKSRPERGGISGRTIGVPLATRSQTRTIENYFKAKTAAKKTAINQTETVEDIQQHQNSTEKTLKKNSIYYNTTNNDQDLAAFPLTSISSNHELINNGLQEHQQPLSLQRQLSLDAAINKQQQQQQSDFIFDLSEDTTDTDNTELSDEYSTASGGGASCSAQPIHSISNFDTHRSPMRSGGDSNSSRSSTTDNIFLQEPVLTLNVDKSPNQASSIKINKTLEIEPIFSSPPAITSSVLNGRFNKIVSLQCSPIKLRDSFGFEAQLAQNTIANSNCYALSLEHDNSSCDSGVAFVTTTLETFSPQPAGVASASTRRRKPATPHRIVCPSPIKAAPRIVSPACGGNIVGIASATSGRKIAGSKSQRQHGSKTRRRLNQPKEQASTYQTTSVQNDYKQNGHAQAEEHQHHIKNEPDEQEYENLLDDAEVTSNAAANNFCQTVQKSFLNTAVNYASTQQKQQNTLNKSHKPPATAKAVSAKPQTASSTQHQQPKIKLYQPPHAQPLAVTNGNRELTTFFQVRRSERKTKTAVKEEMMRNLEQAILEERAEGLKVAHFENKGRGIVSERRFQRGEFVIEYVGDLISMTEAAEREKQYALDENAGCYMYYFKHKNQQYCIDATIDTGKLGRLVNHSRNGNLITKVVVVKQRPHLILIAKDDIEEGEELTYDYGDRSKESLLHHPWLAF